MAGFEPHIWCPDLGQALGFYTDILGFGIVAQYPERSGATWYQLQRDDHTLMLAAMPQEPIEPGSPQAYTATVSDRLTHGGPLSLYVSVSEGPDNLYYRAQTCGARVVEPIWNPWWGGRQFTVEDPSGVWVTISGPFSTSADTD